MKFSYSWIKEITPGIPSKEKFAEEFALKSFEVDAISGDMMDIKITANRWCDASSHDGIAKEAAVIFGLRTMSQKTANLKEIKKKLRLVVDKNSGCLRYIGVLAEISKKSTTPRWMKQRLITCGIRPITPIVDVLNYTMIETGQPMHSFDADKIEGHIIVRKAKKGEKIETIDQCEYQLGEKDIVIADANKILAIAGIKGGRSAEITNDTKNIIIESANFDPVSVYRTSQRIGLATDASRRYSHGMSSIKVVKGMERALWLLTEICFIKPIAVTDKYIVKDSRKIIKFNVDKLCRITGVDISKNQAVRILAHLGFKIKGDMVEVPPERVDVQVFENLVEEVIRIYGLNEIRVKSPTISVVPIHNDPIIIFREKIKRALVGIGFDEVISYSFGNYDVNAPEIINPISREKSHMRTNLVQGLCEAIEKNRRTFENIAIFEFGKVFESAYQEHWSIAVAVKAQEKGESMRLLRGAIEIVLKKIGIHEVIFTPSDNSLMLKIDGKKMGKISLSADGKLAFFEANAEYLMKCSEGEFEYEPPSPYPAITRDVSLWVANEITVGALLESINAINADNLSDVDLIDYYPDDQNARTGITLRLVFQSLNKTLTDSEIDAWMHKVRAVLEGQAGVEIR